MQNVTKSMDILRCVFLYAIFIDGILQNGAYIIWSGKGVCGIFVGVFACVTFSNVVAHVLQNVDVAFCDFSEFIMLIDHHEVDGCL